MEISNKKYEKKRIKKGWHNWRNIFRGISILFKENVLKEERKKYKFK